MTADAIAQAAREGLICQSCGRDLPPATVIAPRRCYACQGEPLTRTQKRSRQRILRRRRAQQAANVT